MAHHFELVDLSSLQKSNNTQGFNQTTYGGTRVDIGNGQIDQSFNSANFESQNFGKVGAEPSWIPNDSEKQFVIRAAETVYVKGMFNGFTTAASDGINTIIEQVSKIFGSNEPTQHVNQNPFRPSEVHTGMKVVLDDNEILSIHPTCDFAMRGLIITNSVIAPGLDESAKADKELTVGFYNMTPCEILIQRGQIIAIGIITGSEKTENSKSINLNKQ